MKRLSVIIPVHNAKEDLPGCINSILKQLSAEDELLLIEDSSTDGSYELCDSYAAENPIIQTHHVNFKGPSPTRNYGIQQSTGEYILFVDADDWVEENTVDAMLQEMPRHHMVVGGYYMENESGVFEKKLNSKPQLQKEELLELYRTELLNVLWNKMFVASIIKDNNISFDENIKKGEDLLFILQYTRHIKTSIAVLDGCFYHYISKNTGINRSHKETMEDKINRLVVTIKEFDGIIQDKQRLSKYMLNLYFRLIRDYLSVDGKTSIISKIMFIKKQGRHKVVNEILNIDPNKKMFVFKFLHLLHMDLSMFVLNKMLLK